MNELIEIIKIHVFLFGELMEVVLNGLSLICIVVGLAISLMRSIQERRRSPGVHLMHTYFRRVFGGWLVVALEFQLAADIVGTIISPTNKHLIELGAVAVIRTFLNYFLNRELTEQMELSRITAKKQEQDI